MRNLSMIECDYPGAKFAGFNTSKTGLAIVRRADLSVKVIDGLMARLAGDLLSVGDESELDFVMETLSGRWSKPHRLGFAVSDDGRWLAYSC